MTRVLVVDDEDAIREAVSYSLGAEGFEVESRNDGAGALAAVERERWDLVVLDVMLGDMSGVEVCRRIRANSDVPVLMLTALDAEADLVLGFEAGADDYVVKPFSMRELLSRSRAILRRRELDRGTTEVIRSAGDVRLDMLRHEAFVGEERVPLTPIEFRMVALLASEDRVFSRRELLTEVWETTFIPDERSCDVHIANVRRKIEADPSAPTRLVTVRGAGYRLDRT